MLEFSAGYFISLTSVLHHIENVVLLSERDPDRLKLWFNNIPNLINQCDKLGLDASSAKAHSVWAQWQQRVAVPILQESLRELSSRIQDELFSVCFYYVLPNKADYLTRDPRSIGSGYPSSTRLKRSDEYFGQEVVSRFLSTETDLREAIRCYVFECLPACVFHLMRATEIGIPKVARLCGIKDPKPSWGAVLTRAEKLTQDTKYEDLPVLAQPHIEFLRMVVADMRSLQRAWRNKVTHVEDRLIAATATMDIQDVHEIFVATRSFLRRLAEGLPSWC